MAEADGDETDRFGPFDFGGGTADETVDDDGAGEEGLPLPTAASFFPFLPSSSLPSLPLNRPMSPPLLTIVGVGVGEGAAGAGVIDFAFSCSRTIG